MCVRLPPVFLSPCRLQASASFWRSRPRTVALKKLTLLVIVSVARPCFEAEPEVIVNRNRGSALLCVGCDRSLVFSEVPPTRSKFPKPTPVAYNKT